MTSNWAALVWGRTFSVGYRSQFLVLPEDFTAEQAAWAMRFARATARTPERLDQHPRWSLFRGPRHTVMGLTAHADLFAATPVRDASGEPVHVFLGLVSPHPAALPPPQDLELFRPLYRFIRDRWEEPDTPEAQRSSRCPYVVRVNTPSASPAPRALNREPGEVLIVPPAQVEALWQAAAGSAGVVSLCLNVATIADAQSGPFLNVTLTTATAEQRLPHAAAPAAPPNARRQLLDRLRQSGGTEVRETPLPSVSPATTPEERLRPPELPQPPGTLARPRRPRG